MSRAILKLLFIFISFTFVLCAKLIPLEQRAMVTFEESGISQILYSNIATLSSSEVEKKLYKETTKQELFVRFTSASKSLVGIGDFVKLTVKVDNTGSSEAVESRVSISLANGTRYVKESFKVADKKMSSEPLLSASSATFTLNNLEKESTTELSFVVQVGVKARERIEFLATASAKNINSNNAKYALTVENNELFIGKSTIIGSVTVAKKPVKNVRIYMEDGTFTLTDDEGKYHFEGIESGTHVVQLDIDSIDTKYNVVGCGDNVRFAGSKVSQFVEMFSGTLHKTDFCLEEKKGAVKEKKKEVTTFMIDDVTETMPKYSSASLKNMTSNTEWVWPKKEFVPSVSAVNLLVKHKSNQTVSYEVNGKAVDKVHMERTFKLASKAMTFYKGVHLQTGDNKVVALVKVGKIVIKRLERNVHYSSMSVRAKVIKEFSYLIADGKQTPVLAVKFFDKDGYPVRGDVIGKFKISQPYKGYRRLDELGQNPLSQSTTGEDYVIVSKGMAYIKLEPTTKAGEAILSLPFLDRTEELKVWLKPKVRDWILVGFAKGSIGYANLSKNIKNDNVYEDKLDTDKQISLFAKGKVLGSYLLTASYNNKKGKKELLDVIEPKRYYTIYGDKSERGMEAASVKKLYLKIEKDNFYAMVGDYVTGFNDMELSKYNRTLNGAKGEYHSEHVDVQAFGSDSDQSFVKDEIAGDGTSGLYRLSNRNIIINSEKVSIETRDRFQSDNVLDVENMRPLLDYNIDYFNGTIFFKKPIFSRDNNFNPITIVVDYEVKANGESKTMGARVALKVLDEKVQVASTYIKEELGTQDAQLAAVDMRVKVGDEGILEVEYAQSTKSDVNGKKTGLRAEYEHNGKDVYTKAYYSKIDKEFGLKQQRANETDREKYGVEARYKASPKIEATGKIYRDKTLSTALVSDVAEGLIEYQGKEFYAQGGYRYVSDTEGSGQQLMAALGKGFFEDKLMIRAREEKNIHSSSVNRYPDRTIVGMDIKITDQNILFAEHEIEKSGKRRELSRIGVRSEPWSGGRIQSSVNQEMKDAKRVFSEVGIQQTVKLTEHFNIDLGLDQSKVINGFLDESNVSEDFTSYSSSLNYHKDGLSSTLKAELKETDTVDTMSLSTALLIEFDSELELMVGAQYMESSNNDKAIAANLSVAYRPINSDYAVLNKLQYIDEKVNTIESRKIINDFNLNYKASEKFELSLYQGVKDVTDSIDDEQFRGLVSLSGLRMNFGLTKKFDMMVYSNFLHGFDMNQEEFNHGVGLGWNAFHHMYFMLGYNFEGFRDDDFSSGTQTQKGVYIDFMMKFQ